MSDGPYLLWRAMIGRLGGNQYPQKVTLITEKEPGATTVTLEEYRAGKRP